jgi:hypothetical protein
MIGAAEEMTRSNSFLCLASVFLNIPVEVPDLAIFQKQSEPLVMEALGRRGGNWLAITKEFGLISVRSKTRLIVLDPAFADDYLPKTERVLTLLATSDPRVGLQIAAMGKEDLGTLLDVIRESEYGSAIPQAAIEHSRAMVTLTPRIEVEVQVDGKSRSAVLKRRIGLMQKGDQYPMTPGEQGVPKNIDVGSKQNLDWVFKFAANVGPSERKEVLAMLADSLMKEGERSAKDLSNIRSRIRDRAMRQDEEYFGGWDGRSDKPFADLSDPMRRDLVTLTNWTDAELMKAKISPKSRALLLTISYPQGTGWTSYSIGINPR